MSPFKRLIRDGIVHLEALKGAMQHGDIDFSGAHPSPPDAVQAYADAEEWRKATGRESVLHRIQRGAQEAE